jgi:hypothetical protein
MIKIKEIDKKKKKRKGLLGINVDFMIVFMDEKSKAPFYTLPLKNAQFSEKKSKKFFIQINGETHEFDGDKNDIAGLMSLFKRESDILNQIAPSVSLPSNQVVSEPPHAEIYTQPIPQPVAVKATQPKIVVALYDYSAVGEGELSIAENENLLVLDDSDEDWWLVRSMKKTAGEGYVPKTYVQLKAPKLGDQKVLAPVPNSSVLASDQEAENHRRAMEEERRMEEQRAAEQMAQWQELEEKRLRLEAEAEAKAREEQIRKERELRAAAEMEQSFQPKQEPIAPILPSRSARSSIDPQPSYEAPAPLSVRPERSSIKTSSDTMFAPPVLPRPSMKPEAQPEGQYFSPILPARPEKVCFVYKI